MKKRDNHLFLSGDFSSQYFFRVHLSFSFISYFHFLSDKSFQILFFICLRASLLGSLIGRGEKGINYLLARLATDEWEKSHTQTNEQTNEQTNKQTKNRRWLEINILCKYVLTNVINENAKGQNNSTTKMPWNIFEHDLIKKVLFSTFQKSFVVRLNLWNQILTLFSKKRNNYWNIKDWEHYCYF